MSNDLISRSALEKEGFTHFIRVTAGGKVVRSKKIAEAPAVDAETYLEQLELVKEAFEMAKSTLAPEQKWISVKDRLPERAGRYLCVKRIGKSGMVYVQLMNGDSYGFSMEHIYTDDVTHWMPLPEPPKEE